MLADYTKNRATSNKHETIDVLRKMIFAKIKMLEIYESALSNPNPVGKIINSKNILLLIIFIGALAGIAIVAHKLDAPLVEEIVHIGTKQGG